MSDDDLQNKARVHRDAQILFFSADGGGQTAFLINLVPPRAAVPQ
jgi:hypothetical protein